MESFEQAIDYARDALERLESHRIPATPPNYTVWYTYITRRNPALREAIDTILADGSDFGNEVNDGLFRRFFELDPTGEALVEGSQQIENILSSALGQLRQASDDHAGFGDRLDRYSKELAKSEGLGSISEIIDHIVSETRKTVERSRQIESDLQRTTDEAAELRQHLENARREANTDPLTGIANRKRFDFDLRRALDDATENGTSCCLLLLDIDHFKAFNDRFGHQLGDDVLKLVAKTLVHAIKGRDTAARYGGEEFAILLPETPIDGAVKLAEDIREALATRRLVNKSSGKALGNVTVSIGAAKWMPGEAKESWIARADQALYAAKNGGRNRVEAAPMALSAAE